jgi:hypothetical protein
VIVFYLPAKLAGKSGSRHEQVLSPSNPIFEHRIVMKKNAPLIIIVLCSLAALWVDLDLKNWTEQERVIENDVHHYYGYLPAYFIFDDIKVEKSEYQYAENAYWFRKKRYDNGTSDFGETYGLALLYAPFFGIAHQVALHFDYAPTGFSEPYKFFLLLSTLFYFFAGLVFVKKNLELLGFSIREVSVVLALLGLGTNLFCYASQSAPYPHVYSFALIAAFLYFTIRWHTTGKWIEIAGLSVCFGLISLIYAPNSIVIVLFILYGVRSWGDWVSKKRVVPQLILFGVILLSLWYPQLKYWGLTTGNILGATDSTERFFFLAPVFGKGLFGFQKGWLIYTPVMAFSLAGFFFILRNHPSVRLALVCYSLLALFITFSWWQWWYGESFGQRVLIDSYAVFALPLAAFVRYVLTNAVLPVKVFLGIAGFLFTVLNIFQTYQYEHQSLHYSAMTAELYFRQFGKLEKVEGFDRLLEYPSDTDARNGRR